METGITLAELLTACGISGAGVLGVWIHMRINIAVLRSDMNNVKTELKEEKAENKENYKTLNGKLDKVFSILSEIKVSIASKK